MISSGWASAGPAGTAASEVSKLFNASSLLWSLGVSAAQTLFDAGATRERVNAASAATDEAVARYRQTVLTAFVQVADTLEALAHDQEELAARQAALDSAEANLRTARAGFEKGGVNMIGVLDAQRQRARALRKLSETQGRRLRDLGLLAVASAAQGQDR